MRRIMTWRALIDENCSDIIFCVMYNSNINNSLSFEILKLFCYVGEDW